VLLFCLLCWLRSSQAPQGAQKHAQPPNFFQPVLGGGGEGAPRGKRGEKKKTGKKQGGEELYPAPTGFFYVCGSGQGVFFFWDFFLVVFFFF